MRDTARAAAAYDFFMSAMDWLMIRRWRRLTWARVNGPQVLEAGVGTGLNIPWYPPGCRVTALDSGERFLERARLRAREQHVPVEFVRGDVQKLPFPDNSYDTAVATFLFCSVEDPLQGLDELRRVLKPGGQLLLLEHGRSRGRFGRVMNIFSGPLYRLSGDHIARETETLARQAGLQNVSSLPLLSDVVKIITAQKPHWRL